MDKLETPLRPSSLPHLPNSSAARYNPNIGAFAYAPADKTPPLVMEMYEHSDQMDYGAAAEKYIDAFFQNIQWDTVAARMAA